MEKLIGSILVLAGSAGTGFLYAADFQEAYEQLLYMRQILGMLQDEVAYTHAPLGEVFGRVAVRLKEPWQGWMRELERGTLERSGREFSRIWEEAFQRRFAGQEKRIWIKGACREMFSELGKQLETANPTGLVHVLELSVRRLDQEIRRTEKELKTRKKLSSCLGILGGLFLVILLL